MSCAHLHCPLLEREGQVCGEEVERRSGSQVDAQHGVQPGRQPQLGQDPPQWLAQERQRVCKGKEKSGELV